MTPPPNLARRPAALGAAEYGVPVPAGRWQDAYDARRGLVPEAPEPAVAPKFTRKEIKTAFAPVIPPWNQPLTTVVELQEGRPFGDISGRR